MEYDFWGNWAICTTFDPMLHSNKNLIFKMKIETISICETVGQDEFVKSFEQIALQPNGLSIIQRVDTGNNS